MKTLLFIFISAVTFHCNLHAEREWGKISDIDDGGGSFGIVFVVIFLFALIKLYLDKDEK